ncbi:HDIG domain-containing protein [Natronincola peptidivorans]|uniref:HDIG domain-containing protein n=1 Tax=Natronincola peptidivorans TaxID=426128 RepID=A0A1I0D9K7_9FIRM|nr:HD domain-containing phosphohydrolase [Natronincola peptidivorans]SET28970.1 HDIG domain-containing protein [Natronincola peptidivorans]
MEERIGEGFVLSCSDIITDQGFSLDFFIHSTNVARIALEIAEDMELSFMEKQSLYQAALFHDIGKSKIPQSVLNKKGKLSPNEWEIMKKHSIYSQELFLSMASLNSKNIEIGKIIRYHHENWDGSGYPDRIAGEDIPLPSRIIRIADIFDAITQPRAYRNYKITNALEVMEDMKGNEIEKDLFDSSHSLLNSILHKTLKGNTVNWKKQQLMKL